MSDENTQLIKRMFEFVFDHAGRDHVAKISSHACAHKYTSISVSEAIMDLAEAPTEDAKLSIVAAYCAQAGNVDLTPDP